MSDLEAIIIGAGPAGLACAACLKRAGVNALILEKADAVGAVWRRHYDRLHLHTDRGHSGLPGLPMPKAYPRYPNRAQVVDYLERYAREFDLQPRFQVEARRARQEDNVWRVETSVETLAAPNLIVATGFADRPYRPNWPGEERFGGDIRHSSAYRNPEPYAGKKVLVVGFGNSGAEIALDLAEKGVEVALAVRGPVNVVPRDLFGLPILSVSILLQPLPPALADALAAPLMRLSVGSLKRLGLERARTGPLASISERNRVPVLDIGTVARIRDGAISIRPDIRALDAGTVEFADSRRESCDAIIAATGFRSDLRALLPQADGALDKAGMPVVSGRQTAAPGLYFCGFYIAPTGQLREIGIEARRIADHVAKRARTAVS
ncbi:MAG: NAD(P)/FAD-dependent oxidoreductase [Acetobacteraceae bacterium]|nr:NAD(P)/FAD-dependent oxidoreductase [Acetobacteraceae bacterium]